MPWHTCKIDGIARIRREVACFLVEPIRDDLPMGFRIRIEEDQDGDFFGYPEIAITDADGNPDLTSGRGRSVEETLADTIKYLLESLRDKPKIEPHSIWWNPRF